MTTVREPAVAGRFYPAHPATLRADIQSYLSPPRQKITAIGCIAPHAGYVYSGAVAGAVFSALDIPQHCLLLCPNHTGIGHPLAIMSSGKWRSPLGEISIDADLAGRLEKEFPALTDDSAAHRAEHAVEVELPFLQTLKSDLSFVPIAVGTGRFILLEQLGLAIASVIQDFAHPVLIVASSDMNHYEDDRTTRVKDHKAIEKILAIDPAGLYQTVMNESISMCGFGPTVAMLTAARQRGAKQAELIEYRTSGDVSGDKDMVVGYAGIVVS